MELLVLVYVQIYGQKYCDYRHMIKIMFGYTF